MKTKQLSVVLPSACTGLLAMSLAMASERASVLEEIVVTAQKRSENLQDIPVAVTALTGDMRDALGITTIEDITNVVPGLYYDNLLDRASIRGVGRITNSPGTDPGIAMYNDGFYTSSTTSLGRSTIFNEQIEVLRGPQGTLYGRNATGGAFNAVSRRPRETAGAEVRTSYGSYERKTVEGTITGPITDWLRARLTASVVKQDEGYFRNIGPGPSDGGNADDQNYEAMFVADLGESVEWMLRYSLWKQDGSSRFNSSFTPYTTNVTCTPTPPATTCVPSLLTTPTAFNTFSSSGPSSTFNTGTGVGAGNNLNPASPQYTVANPASPGDRRVINTNTPNRRLLDGSHTVVSNLTWRTPFGADLKWIAGFNTYEFYSLGDFDNSGRMFYDYTPRSGTNPVTILTEAQTYFYEDKEYYSNELNLTSTGDGPLQWLVGAYQYHEKYFQIPIAGAVSNPAQPQLRTVYTRPATFPTSVAAYDAMTTVAYDNPEGFFNMTTTEVEVDSYALFSQVDYQLADRWSATIGARYSWDMKQGDERRRNIIWDPTIAGSRAKAFDNTPPLDCYSADGEADPANPNLQVTRNAATGAVIPNAQLGSCRYRFLEEREWKDWSGTAGVNWTPMDDMLVYAKYSRGYKSGAIRLGSFNSDSEVDPEYLNSYELGLKTNLGERLQLNVSTFYYDYNDYQYALTFRDENNNARTEFANIPKAMSSGAELEMTWVPLDALTVMLSYSYLDTEVESDVYILDLFDRQARGSESSFPDVRTAPAIGQPPRAPGDPANLDYYQNAKGGSLPSSPENKVNASLTYRWDFALGSLTPAVTYSWRDEVSNSTGLLSRPTTRTPSYDTVDARATWEDARGRFSILAYVRNMFDDDTYNTTMATTFNGQIEQIYNLNPPRTWGVEFQYRLGSEIR